MLTIVDEYCLLTKLVRLETHFRLFQQIRSPKKKKKKKKINLMSQLKMFLFFIPRI
jgi:hypothetical protein